jgi:ABC-type antimicrobial peptide transport system permease subunit
MAGLLLAAIGLYGLLAYQIELRRRELGTRVALGARGVDIGSLVLARTARLLVVGLAIGLLLSVWVSRLIVGLVEGTRPVTVTLLVGVCLTLTMAAAAATFAPTRRAVAADPASALKEA